MIEEGVSLDPVLSFTAPFVSPSAVTPEVAVLNGLQIGMVVVDHKAARAGHLVFPEQCPAVLDDLGRAQDCRCNDECQRQKRHRRVRDPGSVLGLSAQEGERLDLAGLGHHVDDLDRDQLETTLDEHREIARRGWRGRTRGRPGIAPSSR